MSQTRMKCHKNLVMFDLKTDGVYHHSQKPHYVQLRQTREFTITLALAKSSDMDMVTRCGPHLELDFFMTCGRHI